MDQHPGRKSTLIFYPSTPPPECDSSTLSAIASSLLLRPCASPSENAICNRYYRFAYDNTLSVVIDNIDENLCKSPVVQDQLSHLVGWNMCFDTIPGDCKAQRNIICLNSLPGLLTAMFYGHISERHGRRLVLLLSISGHLIMRLWIVTICLYSLDILSVT